MTATVMLAGFSVIPNLPAYMVANLGVPQADVKLLYAAGGVASFAVLRLGGRWVDRAGSVRVMAVASPALVAVLVPFVVWPVRAIPPAVLFVAFLFALGLRNVAHGTVASRVPTPAERAGFQSIQSAVQHAASAAGALLAAAVLSTDEAGRLQHMPWVGVFSLGMTLLLPLLVARVQRGLPAAH